MWYDNLNNKSLWSYFQDISSIPRESGNEEGIRDYLVSWAKENNLNVNVDKAGNVIVKCPPTKGFESIPPIALQGHMDMVCVKKTNSNHDFEKDGIEIISDGTYLRAKDTSLGGDNGIALATILDIFTDKNVSHGPLEAIFTVSEETGLEGAFNLDSSLISSKRMINLDSEEEGIFYIGCAGGIEITGNKKIEWQEKEENDVSLKVTVSGLLGGHSGGEIHKGRANAIKVLGRFLNRLPSFRICSLNGGTRRNVIPSSAEVIFNISKNRVQTVSTLLTNLLEELKNEYEVTDPNINITLEEVDLRNKTLSKAESRDLSSLLFLSPTGVREMSFKIRGIVETSDNFAIVNLNEDKINVIYSVRSSIKSAKYSLAYEIQTLLEVFRYETTLEGDYPSWAPNPESPFTSLVSSIYEEINHKKPIITAIHAGLECGIINEKVPNMDSLSLGPNLYDVHSVNEKLDIESAERTAIFVKEMLKRIK